MEQPESNQAVAAKSSWRRPRRWLGLTTVVILVVTVKLAVNFANDPANGKVMVGKATLAADSYIIDLTPTTFEGQHMSFKYPRGLKSRAANSLAGSDVEKAAFGAKDVMSWNLNIDVTSTGNQPLSSDSSYSFRQLHPDIYEESHVTFNDMNDDIMTNKTVPGFEKVAFLQHGAYRATVSLTGDDADGTGPLQTAFNMVLNSWQWR